MINILIGIFILLAGFVIGNYLAKNTKEELKSLYKKGAGERNMTPLLKTTGWRVWSDETEGSEAAWFFNFHDGDYTWSPRESYASPRVFAVRTRK